MIEFQKNASLFFTKKHEKSGRKTSKKTPHFSQKKQRRKLRKKTPFS